jgi:hypothetical protein
LEFIQEIPKEVELVLRGLKRNSNKIIIWEKKYVT